MKITDKNQPILKFLNSKKIEDIIIDPLNSFDEKTCNEEFLAYMIDDINPCYISDAFCNSFIKSSDSFRDLISGTSIYDSFIFINKEKDTIVCKVQKKEGNKLFIFSQVYKLNMLIFSGFICLDSVDNEYHFELLNGGFFGGLYSHAQESDIYEIISTYLKLNLFIKYAEVETKVVNKKTTKKLTFATKLVNGSNVDITYLDCTWFTNIVRSEGFSVSGHFRLQPHKKDGKWTKKLIYINEFQKKGYTKVAKKL